MDPNLNYLLVYLGVGFVCAELLARRSLGGVILTRYLSVVLLWPTALVISGLVAMALCVALIVGALEGMSQWMRRVK